MDQLKSNLRSAVFILLFTPLLSLAQDKNIFNWADGKLKWDDYNGKSGSNETNSISSYMDFSCKFDMQSSGKVIDMEVNAFFDKSLSYAGDSIKSPELLEREQLHFDIIEKHARLLRKELQDQKWEHKSYVRDIEHIYKQFSNNCKTEQKQCDREIKKGKDELKYKEWKERIAKELKKLDKYSSATFVVKLKM